MFLILRDIIAGCCSSLRGRAGVCLGVLVAAVSLVALPQLIKAGASIRAYDPVGMDRARDLLPDVEMAPSARAALKDADMAVVLTEWAEFRALDLADMAGLLAEPVLVDLRNLYNPDTAHAAGLTYHSIGRTTRRASAAPPAHAKPRKRA